MSMTCDGAAVMVSQKSGVAGKMKSINPKIFITHIVPPPPIDWFLHQKQVKNKYLMRWKNLFQTHFSFLKIAQ